MLFRSGLGLVAQIAREDPVAAIPTNLHKSASTIVVVIAVAVASVASGIAAQPRLTPWLRLVPRCAGISRIPVVVRSAINANSRMILLIRLLPLQAHLDITIREIRADAIPVLLLSAPTIDHDLDLIFEIRERIGDRLTEERGAKGPAARPSVPLVAIPVILERANQGLLRRVLPEIRTAEPAIRKARSNPTTVIIMGGKVPQ